MLAPDEYFSIRVGIGGPGESITWVKESPVSWRFPQPGEYVWHVAICRGDPGSVDCSGDTQLAVSAQSDSFLISDCASNPNPTPVLP